MKRKLLFLTGAILFAALMLFNFNLSESKAISNLSLLDLISGVSADPETCGACLDCEAKCETAEDVCGLVWYNEDGSVYSTTQCHGKKNKTNPA